jgi:hypothetical protein
MSNSSSASFSPNLLLRELWNVEFKSTAPVWPG